MFGLIAILSLILTAARAQKCGGDINGEWYLDGANAREYSTDKGWYRDRATYYWEFGPRNALNGTSDDRGSRVGLARIYTVEQQGEPAGMNIIDVLPCEDGYSDLWEVYVLTVPNDYSPNSIKSFEDAAKAMADNPDDYSLAPADPPKWVNCPVVPAGSSLKDTSPGNVDVTQYPIVKGWYKGREVSYFEFGQLNKLETEPVWIFQAANATEPGGLQGNIIDTVPGGESGQPVYTPFWQMISVNVPADKASTLSETPVTAASNIPGDYAKTKLDAIVNCPVSWTAEAIEDDDKGNSAEAAATGLAFAVMIALLY